MCSQLLLVEFYQDDGDHEDGGGGEEGPEGVEAHFLLVVDFHAFFVGVFGEFVSVDDDAVVFVGVVLAVEEHGHEV